MSKKGMLYGWVGVLVILIGIAAFSGQVHLSTTNSSSEKVSGHTVSAVSGSPITGQLLISPYGTKDDLIDLLAEAKYSIRIRIYQLDDDEILQLLKNKARMGVAVQIIIENEIYGEDGADGYNDLLDEIAGSAIQTTTDEKFGTNFVHAKTFLIDDTTYIISTANVTYPSFFMNREYRFVGHDTATLQALTDLFENDRSAHKSPVFLPSYLRVCPYNCRTNLMNFLDQGTGSILIQAQYLDDPQIYQLLTEKINKGVNVQLIRGKYQSLSSLGTLQSHSRILDDPNVHAKNILIDDQQLYIGSMNLSTNAIENNREIGIVIGDPSVISRFKKQFETDREAAIQ